MIREAIDRVLELARPEIMEIGGRQYSSREVRPILEPQPTPLHLTSLSGLVKYCQANFDEIQTPFKIHVKNECEVQVIGVIRGDFLQRDTYVKVAHSEPSAFKPNTFYALEDFLINLRTGFVQDETVDQLVRLFGNVKGEAVAAWSDDGISQAVVARSGIALVENVPVPTLVHLRPYRTFRQIQQPESPFLVRAKQKDSSPPVVALFEAGGEQWRQAAVYSIEAYLRDCLPDAIVLT